MSLTLEDIFSLPVDSINAWLNSVGQPIVDFYRDRLAATIIIYNSNTIAPEDRAIVIAPDFSLLYMTSDTELLKMAKVRETTVTRFELIRKIILAKLEPVSVEPPADADNLIPLLAETPAHDNKLVSVDILGNNFPGISDQLLFNPQTQDTFGKKWILDFWTYYHANTESQNYLDALAGHGLISLSGFGDIKAYKYIDEYNISGRVKKSNNASVILTILKHNINSYIMNGPPLEKDITCYHGTYNFDTIKNDMSIDNVLSRYSSDVGDIINYHGNFRCNFNIESEIDNNTHKKCCILEVTIPKGAHIGLQAYGNAYLPSGANLYVTHPTAERMINTGGIDRIMNFIKVTYIGNV